MSPLPGTFGRPGLDRRTFLKTAAAGAAVAAFPAVVRSAGARRDRPNVLFISTDDLNADGQFCGGPIARTPNLDRLASEGVCFTRNYCQYPVCNPSRSSLMTGLRPDTIRVFDNRYHFRTEVPNVVTLPQLFRNRGYFSARVGKIYHYSNPGGIGTSGLDDPPSWDQVVNPAGRDKTLLLGRVINETPSRHNLGDAMGFYEDAEGRDEQYTDGLVAANAIRLLEEHRGGSFFLGVGFYKPHCPYIVPKKYFDLYPEGSVDVPSVPSSYLETVPPAALASTRPWPVFGVTPEEARKAKRAYYAAISFVDAQIGRVLAALDRLGLRESTVIAFWSDHGYHLGDHGLWFKSSCFEQAARVPLILAPPAGAARGRTCSRIVEHVDLYPTLADLAGLQPPSNLAGVSLRPLLENPSAPWSRPAFTQEERTGFAGWSVRTERWRYTQWDEGGQGEELYDHHRDPAEMHNLAGAPAHAEAVAELSRLVKANWPRRVTGGRARS